MARFSLPQTPCKHADFINYVAKSPNVSLLELAGPFNDYEAKLREGFAQYRDHEQIQDPHVNAVPIYAGHEDLVRMRARGIDDEAANSKYVMPLKDQDRRKTGEPAIVPSFKQFLQNLNVFSESSLVDMDWNNVVVAGSAVVTSLLPVPEKHNESKRALREYYHQKLAPSSDVEVFIWGLDEAAAIEKIKQIETKIRNAILSETTTVRTKNAVTIVSQYPVRHVQIVLRLYKSVSEILTGFDVDSSCFAYDGSQVYGTPRGISAFMSQCNTIDLTRRSPSYESRLAKYAHRGFEVYVPFLERDRIDPTIFERSFARTLGLARLLVLERLPKVSDREAYMNQRRVEKGRPVPLPSYYRFEMKNNMKDRDPEDIAEWDWERDVSNYHTFTIPYGPRITPKKIERLLYQKDVLLNAEWNASKDRKVNLHRHPCFIGDAASIVHDCCQLCPEPATEEEKEVAAEEAKIYVSGDIKFMEDDPGRQAIGSFNPITTDDWLDMAYMGNVEELCRAIVEQDLKFVQDWCSKDDVDINRRDHTGRTPLHLACQSSSLEIVQYLIDAGARIVARLADGSTALHIAAARGHAGMVNALLEKSEANEEAEEEKKDQTAARGEATKDERSANKLSNDKNDDSKQDEDDDDGDNDEENDEDYDEDSENYEGSDEGEDKMTQGSFVKVKGSSAPKEEDHIDSDENQPDVYDVNVIAWDSASSPLHLAILMGRTDVMEILIDRFGADVLLPIKITGWRDSTKGVILTLVLAGLLVQPTDIEITKRLLHHGASSAQADANQTSALQFLTAMRKIDLLKTLFADDEPAAKAALSHLVVTGYMGNPTVATPIISAIKSKDEELALYLIKQGGSCSIPIEDFSRSFIKKFGELGYTKGTLRERAKDAFNTYAEQPVVQAAENQMPSVVRAMVENGVSINTLNRAGTAKLSSDSWTMMSGQKARSLIEQVDSQISSMKRVLENSPMCDPMPLESDSHYLGNAKPGSYAYWKLETQIAIAKKINSTWGDVKAAQEKMLEDDYGMQQRRNLTVSTLKEFEELRSYLAEKGAKTFKDLHPDIKNEEEQSPRGYYNPSEQQFKFNPKIEFDGDVSVEENTDLYIELFEAAWSGDISRVKELTLKGREGSSPLHIAVQDKEGYSPFAIALARGHRSLAKAILDIALAQYEPEDDEDGPRRRYTIASGEDDNYSDADPDASEDEVHLESRLVDEKLTIDNIAQLKKDVGSHEQSVKLFSYKAPYNILYENAELEGVHSIDAWELREKSSVAFCRALGKTHQYGLGRDEFFNAIVKRGDLESVSMMLRHAKDTCQYYKTSKREALAFVTFNHVSTALAHGHTHVAAELIRTTGAGLPLDDLLKQSGISAESQKSKYYPGLLVKGQRKNDWAQEGGARYGRNDGISGMRPFLLQLAYGGKLGAIEWALSGTPRRLYHQFGEENTDDPRVVALAEAEGGFQKAVDQWFDTRSHLAIHCAILSFRNSQYTKDSKEKLKAIKHLIEVMPGNLEVKSSQGLTPLLLAFSELLPEVAEILIKAGADQSARDAEGRNLVHMALSSNKWQAMRESGTVCLRGHDYSDNGSSNMSEGVHDKLKKLLNLIDRRLLPSLLSDRSSDGPTGLTPLARYIWLDTSNPNNHTIHRPCREYDLALFKLILGFMSHSEVIAMDGSGQLIAHHLVKTGGRRSIQRLQILLDLYPDLVFRENASGQTPVELAESLYVRQQIDRFKEYYMGSDNHRSWYEPHELVHLKREPWKEPEDHSTQLLQLLRERAEKNGNGKRMLVSVLQASEVSKRIAKVMEESRKKREGADAWRGYAAPPEDEVAAWGEI